MSIVSFDGRLRGEDVRVSGARYRRRSPGAEDDIVRAWPIEVGCPAWCRDAGTCLLPAPDMIEASADPMKSCVP